MNIQQAANECPGTTLGGRRTDARRLYSAVVFLPLLYVMVRYLPPVVFFGLVLTTAMIALLEYYRLHFKQEDLFPDAWLGSILTAALLASQQWPGLVSLSAILLAALPACLVIRMRSARGLAGTVTDTAIVLFGMVYVGLTLGYFLLTRAQPGGEWLIFFVVLVTWAGDAGGYYVGMRLGRRPLAPAISPKKTVEGLIGGLMASMLTALVARSWFLPQFGVVESLLVGLALGAIGALGDLAESALKRSAGVKDSGSVIPAHGGMLDRIDSLLFTGPVFYYYVVIFKGDLAP